MRSALQTATPIKIEDKMSKEEQEWHQFQTMKARAKEAEADRNTVALNKFFEYLQTETDMANINAV